MKGSKKGSYWVRNYISFVPSEHGQKLGDIVIAVRDHQYGVAYSENCTGTGPEDFREATQEEKKFYDSGGRNVNDMKEVLFKKGDTLEFISKTGITTCFLVGQHVTFKAYDSDLVRVSGTSGNSGHITEQSAYAKQFKLVSSISKKEVFKKGDIVRCLKENSTALKGLCKKGDLLRIESINGTWFTADEHNGKETLWTGITSEEFELTGLRSSRLAKSSKFKIGDLVTIKSSSGFYKDQGLNSYGELIIHTIKEFDVHQTYPIKTNHNSYNEEDLELYIKKGFKEGDLVVVRKDSRFYSGQYTKNGKVRVQTIVNIDYSDDYCISTEEFNYKLIDIELYDSKIHKNPISEKTKPDTKFKIGDFVKITTTGFGVGSDHMNKIVQITEIGTYNIDIGYKFEPPLGNCKTGSYDGFVSEISFTLDSNPIKYPDPLDYNIPLDGSRRIYESGHDPYLKEVKLKKPLRFKVERI